MPWPLLLVKQVCIQSQKLLLLRAERIELPKIYALTFGLSLCNTTIEKYSTCSKVYSVTAIQDSSEYVAFHHDDDWRASIHLGLALTALKNGN